ERTWRCVSDRAERATPRSAVSGRTSMPEVATAGEDHRDVVSVGQLDRHLVADRATGLDDRGDARRRCELERVREREIRVAGHDRELRPIAGAMAGDLDRDETVRLARAD